MSALRTHNAHAAPAETLAYSRSLRVCGERRWNQLKVSALLPRARRVPCLQTRRASRLLDSTPRRPLRIANPLPAYAPNPPPAPRLDRETARRRRDVHCAEFETACRMRRINSRGSARNTADLNPRPGERLPRRVPRKGTSCVELKPTNPPPRQLNAARGRTRFAIASRRALPSFESPRAVCAAASGFVPALLSWERAARLREARIRAPRNVCGFTPFLRQMRWVV
ncbi:hypothetical protein DFH09DRAFT_1302373 [Mycena vulgaris]|nr:hypothetical protein DFH09DRAFT_1302373 [Mycena vulgaris]